MKKQIFFLSFGLTILSLTSCKRNFTCSCVSPGKPQLEIIPQTYKDTRKNAQKKCEDFRKQTRENIPDATCELK